MRADHLIGHQWMRFEAAIAVAILFAACGKSTPVSPTTPTSPTTPVDQGSPISGFITGIAAIDGTAGTEQPGVAPQPAGGPALTIAGSAKTVTGGSTVVRLDASDAFQTIYVFVGNGPTKVNGLWRLRLAVPARNAYVIATLSPQAPSPTFDVMYAVASLSGAVGAYAPVTANVSRPGPDEVHVGAWWDTPSDIDLMVVEPSGEEVSWQNPFSATGGTLDVDSNSDCVVDNRNNENVRWRSAPSGTFHVRLDYSSSCGVPETKYVVLVDNAGASELFRGSFTGAGSRGAAGLEKLVTTFVHGGAINPNGILPPVGPAPFFERSPSKRRN